MKWSIALSLVALLSAFLSIQATVIPVASGVPEEAVGRVVSVISGDALGVQMLISDPRTSNVDSIKLADIASPSTVTPEGKAAQKYARSLLWNKTVYLDIDDNTSSGRNEWSQLICVVYLMDSEYRPIWPPVNRIIVDAGYAKVNDDKKNEFNASTWWQEPTITEGTKENLLRDMAEEKAATSASSNNGNKNFDPLKDIAGKKIATNASSINNNRISDPLKDMAEKKAVTGGSVTVGDASKSSIMQKDSKTGRVSIGYRA
jgi:endonuclease YncB( thermonuclease family)